MKTNKEKVYDFLKLQLDADANGLSTLEIAEALSIKRPNVSSILNALVEEGSVKKSNGRPVLYGIARQSAQSAAGCFENLIGHDGSLKKLVQRAQAAVLYPQKRLNTLVWGERGTGKKFIAMLMHQYAAQNGVVHKDAPYILFDCRDSIDDELEMERRLFGAAGAGGAFEAARRGVLVIDNAQLAGAALRKTIGSYIENPEEPAEKTDPQVIVLCDDSSPARREFEQRLPITLEMPSLGERPLSERRDMIQAFLAIEAARAKRAIVINAELMRCLLLYDCEYNLEQFKMDIKIGCANAYVRERRNQDGLLNLYIGDFENYVRKGFLNYPRHRQEIESIIPADFSYVFSETSMEMTALNKDKIRQHSIYERIDRRSLEFAQRGMSESDIGLLLVSELETMFRYYQNDLLRQVVNTDSLARLVDGRVIALVREFLDEAAIKLGEVYTQSVFYGLCLHLESVRRGERREQRLETEQIREILENYKAEYSLCLQFATRLEAAFDLRLAMDEVVLIAMFICFKTAAMDTSDKPVVLYAMHGAGLAKALAATINSAVKTDNAFDFEVPFGSDPGEFYEPLRERIGAIDRGSGVIVVYDMDFVAEALVSIGHETNIEIRMIALPITELGFDFARRAAAESDIDAVYNGIVQQLDSYRAQKSRVVITLCQTGEGGAEELRRYIQKHGVDEGVRVVALPMNDAGELRDQVAQLMKDAAVQCIVGPRDPKLFGIPFVSVGDVFAAPPEQLPGVIQLRRQTKEREKSKLSMEAVYSYLSEHLESVDIERLKKTLPGALGAINAEIAELSFDTETGLFLHIACSINRMAGGGAVPANLNKESVIERYLESYKKLVRIVKPLEKTFKIIFNDDELAYILTIIFKL